MYRHSPGDNETVNTHDFDMADLKGLLNNCNVPQFTRIQDIQRGIPYKIKSFSKTRTRYGDAACAILQAPDGDHTLLNVYLPRRFLSILTDDVIESYNNADAARLSLVYRGNRKGIEFI